MVLIKEIQVINEDNTKKIVILNRFCLVRFKNLEKFRNKIIQKYTKKLKGKIKVAFIYFSL